MNFDFLKLAEMLEKAFGRWLGPVVWRLMVSVAVLAFFGGALVGAVHGYKLLRTDLGSQEKGPDVVPGAAAKAPLTSVSKSEAERTLREILPPLSAIIDQGNPLSVELRELLERQRQVLLKFTLADYKSQVATVRDKFAAARTDFFSFYQSHGYDQTAIDVLLDWNDQQRPEFGNIVVDLGNYFNELNGLSIYPSGQQVFAAANLWDLYARLNSDRISFQLWVSDTQKRIRHNRDQLQQALKAAQ